MSLSAIKNKSKFTLAMERRITSIENEIKNPVGKADAVFKAFNALKEANVALTLVDLKKWLKLSLSLNRIDIAIIIVISGYINLPPAQYPWHSSQLPISHGSNNLNHLVKQLTHRRPEWLSLLLDVSHIQLSVEDYKSVCDVCAKDDWNIYSEGLKAFFGHKKSYPILLEMQKTWRTTTQCDVLIRYRNNSPIAKKIATARWKLVRFWLNTVRSNIKPWIDHLYEPGVGPMYLKGLASWNRSTAL